jgi:hypothetical protein
MHCNGVWEPMFDALFQGRNSISGEVAGHEAGGVRSVAEAHAVSSNPCVTVHRRRVRLGAHCGGNVSRHEIILARLAWARRTKTQLID